MATDGTVINEEQCFMNFNQRTWLPIYTSTTCFILPYLATIGLYMYIVVKTKQSIGEKKKKLLVETPVQTPETQSSDVQDVKKPLKPSTNNK